MGITTRRFSLQSKWDGVLLKGICMIPENPIGILQMVHGMCEHKERYLHMMEYMAGLGYITLLHDNRGHGESVKDKEDIGYCYKTEEKGFVEDIFLITRRIRKKFPGLPLVLYGHSMGSLAVRAYLARHDDAIDGLIIAGSPAYSDGVPLGSFLVRRMIRIKGERYRSAGMQNLVLGNFEKRYKKENRPSAWLAAKESVAEEFERDSLCKFTYTLNGFETLLNLERIVYRAGGFQMKNPELPILLVSGADDPCYISERKWQQTVDRLLNLGYGQVTAVRFEGMRHEIHNEDGKEKVFLELDKFCREVMGYADGEDEDTGR
ncbi:MAG: lysophospholipase [Bacteroidales bacterium]|nr:lysophospholipase [Clostridium sp.]MCM1204196.1 lysophospholipase [Bacteroidales bacterium]